MTFATPVFAPPASGLAPVASLPPGSAAAAKHEAGGAAQMPSGAGRADDWSAVLGPLLAELAGEAPAAIPAGGGMPGRPATSTGAKPAGGLSFVAAESDPDDGGAPGELVCCAAVWPYLVVPCDQPPAAIPEPPETLLATAGLPGVGEPRQQAEPPDPAGAAGNLATAPLAAPATAPSPAQSVPLRTPPSSAAPALPAGAGLTLDRALTAPCAADGPQEAFPAGTRTGEAQLDRYGRTGGTPEPGGAPAAGGRSAHLPFPAEPAAPALTPTIEDAAAAASPSEPPGIADQTDHPEVLAPGLVPPQGPAASSVERDATQAHAAPGAAGPSFEPAAAPVIGIPAAGQFPEAPSPAASPGERAGRLAAAETPLQPLPANEGAGQSGAQLVAGGSSRHLREDAPAGPVAFAARLVEREQGRSARRGSAPRADAPLDADRPGPETSLRTTGPSAKPGGGFPAPAVKTTAAQPSKAAAGAGEPVGGEPGNGGELKPQPAGTAFAAARRGSGGTVSSDGRPAPAGSPYQDRSSARPPAPGLPAAPAAAVPVAHTPLRTAAPPADGPRLTPTAATQQPDGAAIRHPGVAAAHPRSELRVRLDRTADEPRVEVRFAERAGELHVSVRTADADLSQNLRASLPELVEGLDRRGYNAEIWRPAGAGAAGGPQRDELRRIEGEAAGGQGFGTGDQGAGQGEPETGRNPQPPAEEWEEVWNTSRRQSIRRTSPWQAR